LALDLGFLLLIVRLAQIASDEQALEAIKLRTQDESFAFIFLG
jgi:hypothetical protein